MEKFPLDTGLVSWDTSISQQWDVEEAKTASGMRRTLVQQALPRWTFSLNFPALSKQQADSLLGFFARMRGSWGGFLYKDYENHHVDNAELLQQGESYYCRTNLATMFEQCHAVENLHVFVDGAEVTDFTEENGVITFEGIDIEGVVTATYDYYYLVCFKNSIELKQVFDNVFKVSLTLEVVRE